MIPFRWSWLGLRLVLGLLGWVSTSYGFENRCYEKSLPQARPSTVCQGLTIPAAKTRNFLGEGLVCSHGEHNHTRQPVPFDEEEWRDLLTVDPFAAKEMLRRQPVPEWSSTIPYTTQLQWRWEECRLSTDFRCGSTTVCSTERDEDGKPVERCHEEPNTCFLDHMVTESRFCSHEEISLDIAYQKTDEEYPDRLTNGYDLLAGESELVTASNGIGFFDRSSMSPTVNITEPRNNYRITRRTGGDYDGGVLQCRQFSDYHIGFDLYPEGRIRSRSGNAFALPTDIDGEPLEALIWKSALDEQGIHHKKAYPVALRVQDYGATSLAEFSRDVGDLFKNVVVRIELFENGWIPWPWPKAVIYIKEGQGVVQTLNALSDDQKVRRSKLWQLMLASESMSPSKNMYRSHIPWFLYYPARLLFSEDTLSYENHLHPGTEYRLRLTVYQKGISIYNQACEDDPSAWDCQPYLGSGWLSPSRYESGYFSDKSLDVTFTTPDDVNQRSWWPSFWNTVGLADDLALLGVIAAGVLKLAAGVP